MSEDTSSKDTPLTDEDTEQSLYLTKAPFTSSDTDLQHSGTQYKRRSNIAQLHKIH